MYNWLNEALADSAVVVTANRRLARILGKEYGAQQISSGLSAWRNPEINAWQDWLIALLATAQDQKSLPTRITAQQSQWLWERCLRKELAESDSSLASLVRMSRDTWQRLADWQIPITEVARSALSADQRMYAVAAGRYLGILEREHWVDDAGLAGLVLELIAQRRVTLHRKVTFAGFDRRRPILDAISNSLRDAGSTVCIPPARKSAATISMQQFGNTDAELRAAGAWARTIRDNNSDARIAIISGSLEQDAERVSSLVREGFTPGWQYGHRSLFAALNVSYGRKILEYPAIAIAMLVLRWIVRDLSAPEVGLLLRSPVIATSDLAGRSRLELQLRKLPDRAWSPAMISAALRRNDDDADGSNWLAAVATLTQRRKDMPIQVSPADWAVYIDETLRSLGWPGAGALDSAEFQLINRWRELLNDFARLDLVSPRMNLAGALSRLEILAGDTVFQPESTDAAVQLMGPLEASGAEFDAVWISGLTAANWPPAGTASVLISRRLQQQHGMPDAIPKDTLQYAESVLQHLMTSAQQAVCSYAITVDNVEQTRSELLLPYATTLDTSAADPGWHATRLIAAEQMTGIADKVPAVEVDEVFHGGAGTVQRQRAEPFSAFVVDRMGARSIFPQAVGIPALVRGDIIHTALHRLFVDLPDSSTIQAWHDEEVSSRINAALDSAFARHERNTDAVLQQLFAIERRRVARLLRQIIEIDAARGEFEINSVEGRMELAVGNIRLPLRFDRVDEFSDGHIAILDYKSGAKKKLLRAGEEANEIQLFVYACATEAPVAALALVNIDSREIAFDGAGRGYTDEAEWPELLQRIKDEIAVICDDLAAGDVRLNIEQGVQDARRLNLLSRFTELRRDY